MFPLSRRSKKTVCLTVAAVLIAGSFGPAVAAPRSKPPVPSQIDPAVVAAFDRMSDYVAGLRSFELATTYSFDVVAKNGQTVTVDGTGHYLARRPDKLVATVRNDLFARTYVYDGKTLVVASPDEKYYARIPARPTIREMLADAAAEHAIEIPAADLFDLGTPDAASKRATGAFRVGTAMIGGVAADHYAFRSKDRDWEVWIRSGDKPVPLKLTLVDRDQPSRPRYTVTFVWWERSDLPDADFVFASAPDHKPIGILRVGKPQGSK